MSMRRLFKMSILCLLLVTGLSACAVPSATDNDAPMKVSADDIYLLSPGDTIHLTITGDDKLTGDYMIDQRGFVTIPMLGDIEAQGLFKGDFKSKLEAAFVANGYLKKPLIAIDTVGMRPFFILGEVKNPGSYPYRPSMTAFKAIALAGGYTPRAAQNRILIDRGEGEKKQRLNAVEDTPVLPGDSITVRERIF